MFRLNHHNLSLRDNKYIDTKHTLTLLSCHSAFSVYEHVAFPPLLVDAQALRVCALVLSAELIYLRRRTTRVARASGQDGGAQRSPSGRG